jgi:YHS domain-containing protein
MIFGELSEFLPWIIRIIVVLLILRLVRNFFSPAPRSRAQQPPPRRGPASDAMERSGGKLVRDPQCGTYIPMSNSVHLVSGGETLYFCSAACRDAYRQAKSA